MAAKHRVFQVQQGTAGRFPPIPVTLRVSSFKRSESPSLDASSPLVPSVSLHYAPESGEKGEFSAIAVNVRQWHNSDDIPLPPNPRSFYANPDPHVKPFVDQLCEQGALKKIDAAPQRHGDEVLELFEVIEEAVEIVAVSENTGPLKCAFCNKVERTGIKMSKCGGCKKIGSCSSFFSHLRSGPDVQLHLRSILLGRLSKERLENAQGQVWQGVDEQLTAVLPGILLSSYSYLRARKLQELLLQTCNEYRRFLC